MSNYQMTSKFDDIEDESFTLRWYQQEASDAIMDYLDDNDGHPLIAVPTGAGKTAIICDLIDQYLSGCPNASILVISHTEEIVKQDHSAITKHLMGYDVGLWSAGLKTKRKRKITVGSIQSMYRSSSYFTDSNLVIVDEAHLINHKNEGMYRVFLEKLFRANVVGLTATPFRLGHGYIHKGKDALFSDLVYNLCTYKAYNRLVDEGWIAKLIVKSTDTEFDTKGIGRRGNDFKPEELSIRFDRVEITNSAVDEIAKYGENYSAWLIFAIDIDHAKHIASAFKERHGIDIACVHSEMENRKETIQDFKDGKYRGAVCVDILTTGFDVKHIDLIGLLRPTESPIVYIQSVGRGSRVVYAPGLPIDTIEERILAIGASRKPHCLVMDFAGNMERLGPINDVKVKQRGEGKKGEHEPITKTCPVCGVIDHPSVKECYACGHKFKFKQKITGSSSSGDIVRRDGDKASELQERFTWIDVDRTDYAIHRKKGKPNSLRVTYTCGNIIIKEWVCIDHKEGSYAKLKADAWVKYRWPTVPANINLYTLFANRDKLSTPIRIQAKKTGNFYTIRDSEFAPIRSF